MYKVKLKGNCNACISDLNIIFTMSRPEKILEDEDFDSSEDLKKMIDKGFFDVEYINVAQVQADMKIKKVFKQEQTNVPKVNKEVKDDKLQLVIENKEHEVEHDIVKAEEVLEKQELPQQDYVKVEEVLNPQDEVEQEAETEVEAKMEAKVEAETETEVEAETVETETVETEVESVVEEEVEEKKSAESSKMAQTLKEVHDGLETKKPEKKRALNRKKSKK